jgi:hypothetical protein
VLDFLRGRNHHRIAQGSFGCQFIISSPWVRRPCIASQFLRRGFSLSVRNALLSRTIWWRVSSVCCEMRSSAPVWSLTPPFSAGPWSTGFLHRAGR